MSLPRRPLIAGNWKMNGLTAAVAELDAIAAGAARFPHLDLMVCPPATLLARFVAAAGGAVAIGGQDCHAAPHGAFTGDIAAEMLADLGATAVIVGHSERRALHHESDADVRGKAEAAWRAGLTAILCVGETADERRGGHALAVVEAQLSGSVPDRDPAGLVIAYEPVWAIGTGVIPTHADVAEMHGFIRGRLATRFGAGGAAVRLLYGGSVKPDNARDLMAVENVDGALVGGASLKATDFLAIAAAVV